MKLFGTIYLVAITAAVTSAQTLQCPVTGTAPKPGPPQKAITSGDPTAFQLTANHSMPSITRKDLESNSGRIEVHWKFSPDEGNTGGLWVQFYSGANPNPVCDEFTDITSRVQSGTLNGNVMYSCGVTVDFDGPGNVINETPVATFASGNGGVCGWTFSPGHTGFDGFLRRVDYYYHCYW